MLVVGQLLVGFLEQNYQELLKCPGLGGSFCPVFSLFATSLSSPV